MDGMMMRDGTPRTGFSPEGKDFSIYHTTCWDDVTGGDLTKGVRSVLFKDCKLPDLDPLLSMPCAGTIVSIGFMRCDIGSFDALAGLPRVNSISIDNSSFDTVERLPHIRTLDGIRLCDKSLTSVDGLGRFPNLRSLYVSDTSITSFKGAEACPYLTSIKAKTCRSLVSLHGLENATKLETLDIGVFDFDWGGEDKTPGRLRSLRGLERCRSLVELDAQRLALTSMEGIEHCTRLKRVNVRFNLIRRIEGLDNMRALHTLHLEENPLASLAGIEPAAGSLRALHVDDTPVSSLEPLRGFTLLSTLHVQRTKVSSLEPLRGCTELHKLVLNGSPVTSLESLERSWPETLHAFDCPVPRVHVPRGKPVAELWVGSSQTRSVHVPAGLEGFGSIWVINSPLYSVDIGGSWKPGGTFGFEFMILDSTVPITEFSIPWDDIPPHAKIDVSTTMKDMSPGEIAARVEWLFPSVQDPERLAKLRHWTGVERHPRIQEWERDYRRRVFEEQHPPGAGRRLHYDCGLCGGIVEFSLDEEANVIVICKQCGLVKSTGVARH